MSEFQKQSSTPNPSSTQPNDSTFRLPSDTTLKHAAKLSIVEDRPIMMDYWTASLENKALIGVKEASNGTPDAPFAVILKFPLMVQSPSTNINIPSHLLIGDTNKLSDINKLLKFLIIGSPSVDEENEADI